MASTDIASVDIYRDGVLIGRWNVITDDSPTVFDFSGTAATPGTPYTDNRQFARPQTVGLQAVSTFADGSTLVRSSILTVS